MRDVPLTSQSLDPLTFGEESVRGAGHRIRPGLDSSSTGHCATVVGNRKKSNGKSWLKSVQRIRYESDFPLYFLSASAHIGSMTVRRPYAAALEWLRAAGLRSTRQRLALTRLLFAGTDRHVTVNALHKEAAGEQCSGDARNGLQHPEPVHRGSAFARSGRRRIVRVLRHECQPPPSFLLRRGSVFSRHSWRGAKGGEASPSAPGTTVTEVDIVIRVRKNPGLEG